MQPGTYALRDYDFEKPKATLESKSSVSREHPESEYELFDYPGEYIESGDGDNYARARIEELHAGYEQVEARANSRLLACGALFKISDHPRDDQNREYLITSARYSFSVGDYESGGSESDSFTCSISCIDGKTPFRAERITPKPVVQGPQTAVVVGKSGEQIWTDKYGRVKVQFFWDRLGKADENSSCWVRVSQNQAGKNWGGMFVPHIGHEVIVTFLEGDPDRPIITGRVYNADNMPPLQLPDQKYKSILRDHFSNEIIFDGTPGEEHLSIHSPSHYSILQVGRSVKQFTRSTDVKCSYDSESYHFGKKVMYTKGYSWSFARGAWGSVKMGGGGSVMLGGDVSVSAGNQGLFLRRRLGSAGRRRGTSRSATLATSSTPRVTTSGRPARTSCWIRTRPCF